MLFQENAEPTSGGLGATTVRSPIIDDSPSGTISGGAAPFNMPGAKGRMPVEKGLSQGMGLILVLGIIVVILLIFLLVALFVL